MESFLTLFLDEASGDHGCELTCTESNPINVGGLLQLFWFYGT